MNKTIHRPEEYTISVRFEQIEDEWMYVARVDEVADIVEYADDANFARELALDSLAIAQEICNENDIAFPVPAKGVQHEYSGRITLRLQKSTHEKIAKIADKEGVSLNSYIAACVERSCSLSGIDEFSRYLEEFKKIIKNAAAERGQITRPIFHLAQHKKQTVSLESRYNFSCDENEYAMPTSLQDFLIKQDARYKND